MNKNIFKKESQFVFAYFILPNVPMEKLLCSHKPEDRRYKGRDRGFVMPVSTHKIQFQHYLPKLETYRVSQKKRGLVKLS